VDRRGWREFGSLVRRSRSVETSKHPRMKPIRGAPGMREKLTIISTYVEFPCATPDPAFEANYGGFRGPAGSAGAMAPRVCHQQEHWDPVRHALSNLDATGKVGVAGDALEGSPRAGKAAAPSIPSDAKWTRMGGTKVASGAGEHVRQYRGAAGTRMKRS